LRILLTNNTLVGRSGSELWVRDVALALLRRGHQPIACSRRLGEVAAELRAATVPVVDDPDQVTVPPDLLHLHHHLEAMTALARFPGVPALYVCHGFLPAAEAPPQHPRIRLYVAVDELVRERLLAECGLDEDRVTTLLNFVDLEAFPQRPPLPERPRRALVFSNHATEETYLPAVRTACAEAGMTLDVVGQRARVVERPGEVLGDYDLVFAQGRSALEAAAVGVAVIVCGENGLGPMVTAVELDRRRSLNFGVRLLRRPITSAGILAELARYDPRDAAVVTRRLRLEAGLDLALDRLLALYERVLADHRAGPAPTAEDEARAVSRYLCRGPLTGGDFFQSERERLTVEAARATGETETLKSHLEAEARERARDAERHSEALANAAAEHRLALDAARHEARAAAETAERLAEEAGQMRRELAWIKTTATWRWRERLTSWRWLVALYRVFFGRPSSSTTRSS